MFYLYTALGICIIVLQTSVFRVLSFQGVLYDFLIPLVVFARLDLSDRKPALLVAIVGFLMDLFSGGIFGLYLTAYFWIYLLIKVISNYFDVRDAMFRSVLFALCVLMENFVLFVFGARPLTEIHLLTSRIWPVIGQMILAAITGPAILTILEKIHGRARVPALSVK